MNVNLPIMVQQDIKSYGKYSLPLCIVFSEDKYLPWVYKEFIKVKSLKTPTKIGNHLQYDSLLDEKTFYLGKFNDVLDMVFLSYNTGRDPFDYLRIIMDELAEGKHIYLDLDEYYISSKKGIYMNYHFTHPLLIYGFDENKKVFKAVSYINEIDFSDFLVTVDEILNGIKGSLETTELAPVNGLYVLKLKPIKKPYPFLMRDYLNILYSYLASGQDENYVYGFDIYDIVLNNLLNSSNQDFVLKYNTLHFLFEHKALFLKSLKFILENNKIKSDGILETYSRVVEMFNGIRLIYLKNNLISNSRTFKRKVTNEPLIAKLYSSIKSACNYEREVLTCLLNKLNKIYNL